MTRYAIYFTPASNSLWWLAGCHWLGRDPESGMRSALPRLAGIEPDLQIQLTHNARRYGFHATLKAPFHLAEGCDETRLLNMAREFADQQGAIEVLHPTIQRLGAFLALQPSVAQTDINALAMQCVRYFDGLRATPSAAELIRRRQAVLSPRHETLLLRWGYPFTEEAYRFHMTLTDALNGIDERRVSALHAAAHSHFAEAISSPLVIDSIAVFREATSRADFDLIARMPFASTHTDK